MERAVDVNIHTTAFAPKWRHPAIHTAQQILLVSTFCACEITRRFHGQKLMQIGISVGKPVAMVVILGLYIQSLSCMET
jgi:hypothetical protein